MCLWNFSAEDMALINVEGIGSIGARGAAKHLLGTLENIGTSVAFVSQTSSEHEIIFATSFEQYTKINMLAIS